jgi:HD-like signal output (HDOD) protein
MTLETTMLPTAELTADEIVRDLTNLPSAPKLLPRLKRLLTDANSSMDEIVMLIRLDPGIAARVLRVGNSAYYSHGNRCFTIDEAVNRVGYDQVYELVSYSVASQVLVRPLTVYGIDADDLWKSSVACALAADLLASRTGQDRDVAYTVGLLHSLGMVAIDDWALRNRPDFRLKLEVFPNEASRDEQERLGFTQADAGAALMRLWDFPQPMCDPVQWQYSPRSSAMHMRMACLLHCAKWIRNAVCSPEGQRPAMPPEAILQMVPLRASELPAVIADVSRRLRDVSSLIELGQNPGARTSARFPVQDGAWMLRR